MAVDHDRLNRCLASSRLIFRFHLLGSKDRSSQAGLYVSVGEHGT